jgi:hypothetical protein
MRRALFATTIFVLISSQALAWSDAGHKVVASIAYARLNLKEREKVVEILREHPRFKADFLDAMPSDIPETVKNPWLFQQASVWPDIAREFKGDDRQYHHSTWHYINVPSYLSDGDEKALEGKLKVNVSLDPPAKPEENMNVVQTIRLARSMLVDETVSKPDKAIMICWLLHLVGDVHQPLHSTALFSQTLFPEGDRGGNLIKTKQRGNLLALWDGFPGGKANLLEARNDAMKLLGDPDMARAGDRGVESLDEQVWLDESWKMARDFAYAPLLPILSDMEKQGGEILPITLQEDYLLKGGALSKLRVVMAGYRLAAVLKQIVK